MCICAQIENDPPKALQNTSFKKELGCLIVVLDTLKLS
jgi:hypothetical protein